MAVERILVRQPLVADYLYALSLDPRGMAAETGLCHGLACSDIAYMREYCDKGLVVWPVVLRRKTLGCLVQSESSIVNSAFTARHVRHIGLFFDDEQRTLAFLGVARASLGSHRFRLYDGTAYRLMTEKEHEAYLKGYVRSMSLMTDIEEYHRSKSTIAMLYSQAPFREEINSLTSDMVEYGNARNYDSRVDDILERVKKLRETIL